MMRKNTGPFELNLTCKFALFASCAIGTARSSSATEILLDQLGGVEVWSIEQPSPGPGYRASVIELRTTDPTAAIVTFTNVKIEGGRVHQAWLEGPFGTPTIHSDLVVENQTYGPWAAFDTHLLLTPYMVGGAAGGRYTAITETNDGTTTSSLGSTLPKTDAGFGAKTGFGDLDMGGEVNAAFFLRPEFQRNQRPFAYVVTTDDRAGENGVFLTVGILGSKIIDAGVDGGAAFGYLGNEPINLFPVPEPSASGLAFACLIFAGWIVASDRSRLNVYPDANGEAGRK